MKMLSDQVAIETMTIRVCVIARLGTRRMCALSLDEEDYYAAHEQIWAQVEGLA